MWPEVFEVSSTVSKTAIHEMRCVLPDLVFQNNWCRVVARVLFQYFETAPYKPPRNG